VDGLAVRARGACGVRGGQGRERGESAAEQVELVGEVVDGAGEGRGGRGAQLGLAEELEGGRGRDLDYRGGGEWG